MPAASSTIRTVPGGKVLVGCAAEFAAGTRASSPEPPLPSTIATSSSTRTTPSVPSPMSSERRRGRRGRPGARAPSSGVPHASQPDGATGSGGGGGSNERPTLTPGPAGVVTSEQVLPFHQRTMPSAPSGSGYQPGAGGCADVPPHPGPLMPSPPPASASRERHGRQFPPQVGRRLGA